MNAGFFYKSAEEREKLVSAERDFIEKRVQKVIDLKKKLCDNTDKRFVVINQKVRCSIKYCHHDCQNQNILDCKEGTGVYKYVPFIEVRYVHLSGVDITVLFPVFKEKCYTNLLTLFHPVFCLHMLNVYQHMSLYLSPLFHC